MKLKYQYGLLFTLHALALLLMLWCVYLLWQRTGSLLQFDGIMLLVVIFFQFIVIYQRFSGCQAQLDEQGNHIYSQQQYLGILCMLFVAGLLSWLASNIHSGSHLISSQIPLIFLLSNYDLYQNQRPILVAKKDQCYFAYRWICYQDITEIYLDPPRKNSRMLIIYAKRRYAQMIKLDLLEQLLVYLPADKMK